MQIKSLLILVYFVNIPTQSHATDFCDGNYASATGKAMFFYQGDYRSLAPDADQLACLMAKYDLLQLTHGFDAKPEREFLGVVPANAIPLKNNGKYNINVKFVDSAYVDQDGRGVAYVIEKVRRLKPGIKIYAYVPATVDNPLGHWDNSMWAQNFICPMNSFGNYECKDFNSWIIKWHNLYNISSNVWIDGFFIDMVNPFYINDYTWFLQTLAVHALLNPATGGRYKIMANTIATESTYYYASWADYNTALTYKGPIVLSERPVTFAGRRLLSGDSVLVEGFYVKAGALNISETINVLSEVAGLKSREIGWSAISSEIGFNPSRAPSLGPTAQEQGNTSDPSAKYVSCGWANFNWAFSLFREYGGSYFTYSEANLGLYSGILSTCPLVGLN